MVKNRVEWKEPQAADRPALLERLQMLLEKLPRFSDGGQQRAFRNILRFLALMLIFTFIARGTAGATLARVDVTAVTRAEITDAVRGTASVTMGSTIDIMAPSGLTILEMYVGAGQTLEAGDPVALFDLDAANEQLVRESATLQSQQLQLDKLTRAQTTDNDTLTSAQNTYNQALADYQAVKATADAAVTAAQQAFDAASGGRIAAQQTYDALVAAGADPPTLQTAYDALQAAITAEATAQGNLTAAQNQAALDLQNPAAKLQEAQTALTRAQQSAAEAAQQAADSSTQNSIEATVLRLDIKKQQETVAALQQLVRDAGILYADMAGTVAKTQAAGQKTGTDALASVYNSSGTFEAQMKLDGADAEKLAVGDACEVTTGGGNMYYTPTATGVISTIAQAEDSDSATVTITLPAGGWKNGQSIQVQVERSRNTYTSCLPLSAIHSDSTGYFILVVEQSQTVLGIENVVHYIPVTILAADNTMVAVEGAIAPDSQIITGSSKTIAVGDRVRVNES